MSKPESESEAYLAKLFDYLQSSRRIRMGILFVLVAVLVGFGVRSVYQLVPRRYTLTITGGDIVSNRHYLAHLLVHHRACCAG